ncbi:MAG: hypothetical protein AVDCRST_MAG05-2282 [uncultured Rubrobacteraceae bacterium]|uniref:Gram-positive cocci surface proteins LPxTG domain-containing protein n=1 Tax=uncultured Rubrobacteraceae bacterium TaxID=349277 RepID=A0A6J4SNL4_9ACTN|nr:MAG: hypothetical protein AVDCRST_MAG05-2282 [uncultured Rubrobacteraceae bacterium]
MLLAVSLAALLAVALILPAPVAAQEETTGQAQTAKKTENGAGKQQVVQGGGQQAADSADETDRQGGARAATTLQDATAVITKDESDDSVDRIEIDVAGCEVEEKGASVTVDDGDSSATFTNAPDVAATAPDEIEATLEATEDQVLITGIDSDLNSGFGDSGTGEVTSSSGITCGRDAAAAANEEDEADDQADEDLEDLDCDELLVLFRGESSSGEQYEDAAAFADAEVRAQVEVCLKKEVINEPDDDLPDTGGPSLLALAILGVVSAAAGLSVIRGGQR